jgi:hypothetical protein
MDKGVCCRCGMPFHLGPPPRPISVRRRVVTLTSYIGQQGRWGASPTCSVGKALGPRLPPFALSTGNLVHPGKQPSHPASKEACRGLGRALLSRERCLGWPSKSRPDGHFFHVRFRFRTVAPAAISPFHADACVQRIHISDDNGSLPVPASAAA